MSYRTPTIGTIPAVCPHRVCVHVRKSAEDMSTGPRPRASRACALARITAGGMHTLSWCTCAFDVAQKCERMLWLSHKAACQKLNGGSRASHTPCPPNTTAPRLEPLHGVES
jgi:hypothetical protein